MFICQSCGVENTNESAKFCSGCGRERDASLADLDLPDQIQRYSAFIKDIFFDHSLDDLEVMSKATRERLKISYASHQKLIKELGLIKDKVGHLFQFKLEFDQNVQDTYAGHDTYLKFRFTNQSDNEFFRVNLDWIDQDLSNQVGLNIAGKTIIKPKASQELGGSYIFPRMGIKEISNLIITVKNQIGEKASFVAESFTFSVQNPDQRITKQFTTNNQISIEGRGVVDASGMGAGTSEASEASEARRTTEGEKSLWKELIFTYLVTQPSQFESTLDSSINSAIGFNEDDAGSVKIAAEKGNAKAQFTLGQMYEKGNGINVNWELAVNWYRKAAEQGNAQAQYSLADMISESRGTQKDDLQIVYWLRKAAEQGYTDAQYQMGVQYTIGQGVEKDVELSFQWYRTAAEQGHARACMFLSNAYLDGDGVERDYDLGISWMTKSAELGDIFAQRLLGDFYKEGTYVDRDYEKSFYWYLVAAKQGDIVSEVLVGMAYESGSGVAQNDHLAFEWFYKSAEKGNGEAQIKLGYIYEEGRGVKKSEEQSNYWFLKAAAYFKVDSIKAIKELAIQSELVPSSIKDLNPVVSSLETRTVSYDDGSSYTGSLVNGARQGQGKVKYSNGAVYEGNWFNDQCQGQGKCFYADGSYYEGSWSNGSEHGEGKCTWADGSYYEGNWSEGAQNGFGKYVYADGSYYEGNWAEGSFQGYGKYVWNGVTYEGNWAEGLYQGFGKYTFADGYSFEGNWLKGEKHGLFKDTLPDGTVVQKLFQNGKFQSKTIETPSNYYPTATNNAKVDLSGFETTERSVCLHCGYEGVFGINHTHQDSAFTRSFSLGWLTLLGTFIPYVGFLNPDDHRTLGNLIFIFPISVAIAYYRNLSIKELNCVNCKNSFYQDKKGKLSKTNNKGDF